MKRIHTSLFLLLIGCYLFSCKKIVADLNVDPNNPTNATANYMFTGTQIANMAAQQGMASRLTICWAGYGIGTFQQFLPFSFYNITANNFDDDWNIFFTGVNKNARITIEKALQLNNIKMAGITKVVQVNGLATATELWGDVPFEEAGISGLYSDPKFESQQTLYPKLIARLDSAIADLNTGIGTVGVEDIHFSGDAAKWKQVAYTLKARLLTDTRQYGAAYEAGSLGLNSYTNSLYAPHGITTSVNENANYSFLTSVRAGSITAEGVYNAALLNPAKPATYRGNAKTNETARFKFYYLENGVNAVGVIEPNTLTTTAARGFFARDASFPLVTYQENILTLAEAALRAGKGFDMALSHLNTYRSFLNSGGYLHATYKAAGTYKYDPYVTADFAAGGMENRDGITPENALLREILEERYVTFYGQHLGWDDERRTRKEAVGVKLKPNNGTQLPWRFIYSQNEINSNKSSPAPVPGLFDAMFIYN